MIDSVVADFRRFVEAPDPRFACRGVGPEAREGDCWIAELSHELAPPASEAEIANIFRYFDDNPPKSLVTFYQSHNGATLYVDTRKNWAGFTTRGIYLAPVGEWPGLGSHASEWLGSLSEDEKNELVPAWTNNAVVFAEVPNSGNYFILGVEGEHHGKIFYFDHDGFEFEFFAQSFEEFLQKITSDPAKMLQDLGCYARYGDGRTSIQWIPEEYLSGMQV